MNTMVGLGSKKRCLNTTIVQLDKGVRTVRCYWISTHEGDHRASTRQVTGDRCLDVEVMWAESAKQHTEGE